MRAARGLRADGLQGEEEARSFFVPGRIEVLGKHTDYAGGSSIVAAVEQGFCLVVAPRPDTRVQICDVARGERVGFEFDPDWCLRPGTGPITQ